MRALILSCTLKPSPQTSSTEALARVVMAELEKGGAAVELIRLVIRFPKAAPDAAFDWAIRRAGLV